MDNLIKRLTAGATGAGNLPKDLYRKDCADALAEIEGLRADQEECRVYISRLERLLNEAANERDRLRAALQTIADRDYGDADILPEQEGRRLSQVAFEALHQQERIEK